MGNAESESHPSPGRQTREKRDASFSSFPSPDGFEPQYIPGARRHKLPQGGPDINWSRGAYNASSLPRETSPMKVRRYRHAGGDGDDCEPYGTDALDQEQLVIDDGGLVQRVEVPSGYRWHAVNGGRREASWNSRALSGMGCMCTPPQAPALHKLVVIEDEVEENDNAMSPPPLSPRRQQRGSNQRYDCCDTDSFTPSKSKKSKSTGFNVRTCEVCPDMVDENGVDEMDFMTPPPRRGFSTTRPGSGPIWNHDRDRI